MTTARPLIAIVDDEPSVRRALGRLITSWGLEVVLYCGGQEFLDSLASSHPSCVVLDLHMPGVSGFDVQSHLIRAGRSIPVIAITGHDTPECQERVLAAGAVAYLCKPVGGSALQKAIREATATGQSPDVPSPA